MITLNANKFIGTLSNLICYTFFKDNYRLGDSIDELLNAFRSEDIVNGDSKLIITADLPEVKDLQEQSTLLSVVKPNNVKEQVMSVTNFKYIQMSINRYLLRGAFEDEYAMSNLVSYLLTYMRVAKRLHMYDAVKGAITKMFTGLAKSSSGGNFYNEINVDNLSQPTDLVPSEMLSYKEFNTREFATQVLATVDNLGLGEVSLNESTHTTTYGSQPTFKAYATPSELILLISPELKAEINVDLLATLLNSQIISENFRFRIITVKMPTVQDVTPIALLVTSDGIQYGYHYNVATEFFDASNLNTNHFLHFSYYADFVDKSPMIIFKSKTLVKA